MNEHRQGAIFFVEDLKDVDRECPGVINNPRLTGISPSG